MSTSARPKGNPRRFWPRFTLRLLLVTVAALCVGLGIWAHRAQKQRRLVERIRDSGGSVRYDFEPKGQPRGSSGLLSRAPVWLRNWAGADYFHDITHVTIVDPTQLEELPRFRRLEILAIANHLLTDDELMAVAELRTLLGLQIISDRPPPATTQIGDRSLVLIATLPELELADVEGSRITSQGLAALSRSQSLKTLYIRCSDGSVNSQSGEQFRRAGQLTHVHIRRYAVDGWGEVVVDW